jgi:predicted transposase/invertase (TIGR01784 family)
MRRIRNPLFMGSAYTPCLFTPQYTQQTRAFKPKASRVDSPKAHCLRHGFFKALFHDEKDPEKLISFLNAVNGHDKKKIERISFRDSFFPGFVEGEKSIFVDIVCETIGDSPEIYIVEVQKTLNAGYLKRWEFYASQVYATELSMLTRYEHLKKVHLIAVMRHQIDFPNDTYAFTGRKSQKTIDESREISLLSLHAIASTVSFDDSMLSKWLHMIKYFGTGALNTKVLEADPVLARALDHAKQLCKTSQQPVIRARSSRR